MWQLLQPLSFCVYGNGSFTITLNEHVTVELRIGQNDTVLDSDASTSFKCHEMNSLTIKFDAPITVCAPYRD